MDTTDPSKIEKAPEDGIYVYGLFIEGARWSFKNEVLEEPTPGEMTSLMPLIHFLPQEMIKEGTQMKQQVQQSDVETYSCPVYKTSVRAGVLSTTGQSTNFILAVEIPTAEDPEHWTLRGTALLTMLND